MRRLLPLLLLALPLVAEDAGRAAGAGSGAVRASGATSGGAPASSRPSSPAQGRPEADAPRPILRRYDVTNGRCEGAEVRIDGRGLKATRCARLDFDLRWSDVRRVCYDYGFRGVLTIETATGTHTFSTTTPAEAKRIVETMGGNHPGLSLAEGCR